MLIVETFLGKCCRAELFWGLWVEVSEIELLGKIESNKENESPKVRNSLHRVV